ncbi:uncharacterized protein ASPGLDRAFT_53322 [Aspergillus glaucus CBS 516.65]|uniref:Uncharacterized protein n=1 Tax=Aspergillus glaucus CBS 516.65 TaxID=1160497 RepID=A0A1L9V4E6_ASPGL|nr:hypothetical protein ASPGLDRAFT_53322 [Aspergillus glaucus CBS 516.65]OJJ78729.1 hypothetical protein ASPGLDRAFT_53322 [Aspergillus glaucus CBS 516.65]
MSHESSSTEPVSFVDASVHPKEIMPTAAYTVQYIMNVELQSKDGTDIPLYNKHLDVEESSIFHLYLGQRYGDKSERFNEEKEDYWLFHIHSNHAEFEIAIGGEAPVLVSANPSYKKITDKDSKTVELDMPVKGHPVYDTVIHRFKLSYNFPAETDGYFDRFVAVRCPKMDNPAITVKGAGHYACLHWVGRFIETTASDTNKFIAVRTTNRLLEDYGERNRNKGYSWFREDGPADVTDRTVTLFPKQLYGTHGSDRNLYTQFVTTDPNNKMGQEHLDLVRSKVAKGSALLAYKYVWHATGKTIVRTTCENGLPYLGHQWDYVSGVSLNQNPSNGWAILLTVFTSITKVATGLLTSNLGGIVEGVIKLGDIFDGDKMRKEANITGFVSAAAKAVDEYNKKNPDKKKGPNTTNVIDIQQNITKNKVLAAHFGTA